MTDVDRSIPFVETHLHLWERGRLHYAWLDEPGRDDFTEEIGDYRMLRADWGPARVKREFHGQDVSGVVHVEADVVEADRLAETAWLDAVSAEHGMPNALIIRCDLDRPDAAETLDRHLETSTLVRGVRMHHLPDDDGLVSAAGMLALAARDLSFDLNPPPGRLDEGLAFASRYPNVTFVLGHAGAPTMRDADFAAWAAGLRELGELPNVACKISGFGMWDHAWTVERIRPWVLACIEAFGVERSMFATNWPVDMLYAPYFEQVDAYRIILADAGFDAAERHALLHGNAERIYRLRGGED